MFSHLEGMTLAHHPLKVRNWQQDTKKYAVFDAKAYNVPFVSTLLGRNRPLPELQSNDRRK